MSLTVRRHRWCFDKVRSRDWYDGSPAISRWFDVYTLLVPDNEAFYIRTLRPCLEKTDDNFEKAELLNFFRQESLHGVAHKAYWKRMREFGIPLDRFVALVNWALYSVLEPLQSHRIRLSMVAAIEHINAGLGNLVIGRDLMRFSDSALREMFYWHFAEEIEHKSVAHRALVRYFPGYATRIAGAIIAFPLFYLLAFIGMTYLLWKEKNLFSFHTARDLFRFWIQDGVLKDSLFHLSRYFGRSFDPWDIDDRHLIDKVIGQFRAASEIADSSIHPPRGTSVPYQARSY